MLPHTPPRIVFVTTYNGRHVRRSLPLPSDGLAMRLCQFLRGQKGKTIEEVGGLDTGAGLA